MTVAYVNSATTTAVPGSTSYPLTQPSGITNGNVLVAAINTGTTVTTASGWTALTPVTIGGGCSLYLYWKIAASETTSSSAFTLGFANQTCAIVVEFSGANTVAGIASATGTHATTTAVSGTMAVANTMACAFAAAVPDAGTGTWTPPGTYTERQDITAASSYRTLELATVVKSSSGAFGADTFTASTAGYTAAAVVMIPPTSATYSNSGLFTLGMTGSGSGVFTVTPTGGSLSFPDEVLIGRISRVRPYLGTITRNNGGN